MIGFVGGLNGEQMALSYLEFKAHCQIKTAFLQAGMHRLYTKKANQHKPETQKKAIRVDHFYIEAN